MDVLCNVTVALADCIEISISNILESATFSAFQHTHICWMHENALLNIEKYTGQGQLESLKWVNCTQWRDTQPISATDYRPLIYTHTEIILNRKKDIANKKWPESTNNLTLPLCSFLMSSFKPGALKYRIRAHSVLLEFLLSIKIVVCMEWKRIWLRMFFAFMVVHLATSLGN